MDLLLNQMAAKRNKEKKAQEPEWDYDKARRMIAKKGKRQLYFVYQCRGYHIHF